MPRPPVTKRKRDSNEESRDLWDPPSQDDEVPTIKRKKPLNLTPKGSSESRKVTDRLENWSEMDATPAKSPSTDAHAPPKPKQKSKRASSTTAGEIPATQDPTSDNPFAVVKRRRGRDSDASTMTEGLVGFFTPEEVNMLENFKLDFCSTNGISGADFDMMVQHSDRDKLPFPHQDTIIRKQEFWRAVYATLPRRQSRSVYRFMRRHFNCSDQKAHHWTEEQDEELIGLHARYGPKWVLIARMIGRSDDDVIQRWKNKLEHRDTMRRGAWGEDETWLLLNNLQTIWKKMRDAGQDVGEDIYCLEESMISWGHVSAMMGHTRSRQQCADRWRKTRRRMAQLRAGGRHNEVYNPANGPTGLTKPASSSKPSSKSTSREDGRYKSNEYVDESDGGDEAEKGGDSMDVDTPSKPATLPKVKSPVDQTPAMASNSKSKAPEPSQVAETPEPETNGRPSREATPEADGIEDPANNNDSDSDNDNDSSSDEDDDEVEVKQETNAPKGPMNDDDSENSSSSSSDEDDNETKQKDDDRAKPTAPTSNSEHESSDDGEEEEEEDEDVSVANETTDKSSDSESESDDETNPSETLSNPIETKRTPVANKAPTANQDKKTSQVESTPTPAPQSQSRLQGMFGRFIKPMMKAASPPPLPRMATESSDDEESESSSDSSTDSDSDSDDTDAKKNAKPASRSPVADSKGFPAKRDIKKEKDNFFSDSEDNQ